MNAEEHRSSLIGLLEKDIQYWFDRKMSIDAHDQDDYYQELKAKSSILWEAIRLIEKIDLSTANDKQQFKDLISEAVEIHRYDWGWGSNWSDYAQRSAVYRVVNLITRHLDKM